MDVKRTVTRLLVILGVALVAATAAVVALAGGPGSAGAKSAAGPAKTTDRVVIRNFAFGPDAIVKAGTTLTFVNDDNTSHAATSTTGRLTPTGSTKESARW